MAGIEGARIVTDTIIEIPPESVLRVPVAVRVPHEFAEGGQRIEFTLTSIAGTGTVETEDSRFRGPTTDF